MLLTKEEIRRVGEWYLHKVHAAKLTAQNAVGIQDSWDNRGFKAMLQARILAAQVEYDFLPNTAKRDHSVLKC